MVGFELVDGILEEVVNTLDVVETIDFVLDPGFTGPVPDVVVGGRMLKLVVEEGIVIVVEAVPDFVGVVVVIPSVLEGDVSPFWVVVDTSGFPSVPDVGGATVVDLLPVAVWELGLPELGLSVTVPDTGVEGFADVVDPEGHPDDELREMVPEDDGSDLVGVVVVTPVGEELPSIGAVREPVGVVVVIPSVPEGDDSPVEVVVVTPELPGVPDIVGVVVVIPSVPEGDSSPVGVVVVTSEVLGVLDIVLLEPGVEELMVDGVLLVVLEGSGNDPPGPVDDATGERGP